LWIVKQVFTSINVLVNYYDMLDNYLCTNLLEEACCDIIFTTHAHEYMLKDHF